MKLLSRLTMAHTRKKSQRKKQNLLLKNSKHLKLRKNVCKKKLQRDAQNTNHSQKVCSKNLAKPRQTHRRETSLQKRRFHSLLSISLFHLKKQLLQQAALVRSNSLLLLLLFFIPFLCSFYSRFH